MNIDREGILGFQRGEGFDTFDFLLLFADALNFSSILILE